MFKPITDLDPGNIIWGICCLLGICFVFFIPYICFYVLPQIYKKIKLICRNMKNEDFGLKHPYRTAAENPEEFKQEKKMFSDFKLSVFHKTTIGVLAIAGGFLLDGFFWDASISTGVKWGTCLSIAVIQLYIFVIVGSANSIWD